jgi:hypothetical protein
MPIVHMAHDRGSIPAGALNVRNVTEEWRSHYGGNDPASWQLWLYDTHVGICLHESERNMHDDSDFYMTYWDEESQAPKTVEFASTRGWCYPCLGSHPDATPEIVAKYEAWDRARREQAARDHEEWLRRQPAKGKTLKVVKGRKVPVGIIGTCIWLGNSGFGPRVGIKDESGQVFWTALSNVEVAV